MSEKEVKSRVVAERQEAIRQFESVGCASMVSGCARKLLPRVLIDWPVLSASWRIVAWPGGVAKAVELASVAMFNASAQAQRRER